VVFRLDLKGKETVLHAFTGPPDGSRPYDGVILDKAGNLYGITEEGGTFNYGAVFKVDSSGKEAVLYSFTGGADGSGPNGPLVQDAAGNLYGVTAGGGSGGCGTIFELDTNGKETVLYDFVGGAAGAGPIGGLIRERTGVIYGVTQSGGSTGCGDGYGCGTVYKVDANGNEIVLYTFTGGSDGAYPYGYLIMDEVGNLYGTTYQGGDSSCVSAPAGAGCGVVFKLTP
jgi:uncharacterized repeat protein (TIGR03803 family)